MVRKKKTSNLEKGMKDLKIKSKMNFKSILLFVFYLAIASCQTNRTEKFDLEYTISHNIKN